MKILKCIWLFFIILIIWTSNLSAQGTILDTIPLPSFANSLKNFYPNLKYSYTHSIKTHNYSGNWDFDGDGLKDSLYFVGNDAVHTRFQLEIILTSENKLRKYEFIKSDFPFLTSVDELPLNEIEPTLMPYFIVHDFNNDGKEDIYLNVEKLYSNKIPRELQQMGITSEYICIYYIGNNIVIQDYIQQ